MMHRAGIYGDLFFETIAIRDGKAMHLEKHLRRMELGCQLLGFECATLHQQIHEGLAKELNGNESLRIRVVIARAGDGFYLPKQQSVTISMERFPLPMRHGDIETLGLYSINTKSCNPISAIKTNMLISVLAAKFANENHYDDVLIFNTNGNICEAISSNVFWIKDGAVFTVSLSEGCVKGVMREVIIETLIKHKVVVNEVSCTLENLLQADEIFLTNSIHQIRSVKQFEGRMYATDFANKINSWL